MHPFYCISTLFMCICKYIKALVIPSQILCPYIELNNQTQTELDEHILLITTLSPIASCTALSEKHYRISFMEDLFCHGSPSGRVYISSAFFHMKSSPSSLCFSYTQHKDSS